MLKFLPICGFFAILAIAAVARFHMLDLSVEDTEPEKRLQYRPFHGDEGVQAWRLIDLLDRKEFVYDPTDYHGPFLLYTTLPLAWLRGEFRGLQLTEWTMRAIPAFYGLGLILLLLAWWREIGTCALLAASSILALSPIMVYFSRYYIMELPMVFLITVAMIAAWRYYLKPGYGWAILFGVAGGLTHATKETGAISFLTMIVAGLAIVFLSGTRPDTKGRFWKHFSASLVLGLLASMICMSVFFKYPGAIWDSVRTYFLYSDHAGSSGHEKPWDYYLKMLAYNRKPEGGPIWTEVLALFFAVIGVVVAFTRLNDKLGNPLFWRWIAGYTILTATIYCLIPHKNPWSMLCWVYSLMLLAGLGFAALWTLRTPFKMAQIVSMGLLIAGLVNYGKQWEQTNVTYRADARNPFVYSHTTSNTLDFIDRAYAYAELHPERRKMKVAIYSSEIPWPVPWYLREFLNLRIRRQLSDPQEILQKQDVIIVHPDFDEALMPQIAETHNSGNMFGIQPGKIIYYYTRKELNDAYIKSRE